MGGWEARPHRARRRRPSRRTAAAAAAADPELLKLSTDRILFSDPGFAPFAEKYKASQAAFFEDYAQAHKKLSEIGSKFDPPEGITL